MNHEVTLIISKKTKDQFFNVFSICKRFIDVKVKKVLLS